MGLYARMGTRRARTRAFSRIALAVCIAVCIAIAPGAPTRADEAPRIRARAVAPEVAPEVGPRPHAPWRGRSFLRAHGAARRLEQVVSRGGDVDTALRLYAGRLASRDRAGGIALTVVGAIFALGGIALVSAGALGATYDPFCEASCGDLTAGLFATGIAAALLGLAGVTIGPLVIERADARALERPRIRLVPRADGGSVSVSVAF